MNALTFSRKAKGLHQYLAALADWQLVSKSKTCFRIIRCTVVKLLSVIVKYLMLSLIFHVGSPGARTSKAHVTKKCI